jgi:hypothetical protein
VLDHTFPYSTAYGSINNGAHRQAAELIGAPALVWHLALWNPARGYKARLERAETIQSYIREVYRNIGKSPGTDRQVSNEIKVLHDDRANVITISFRYDGVLAKVRFEIHTEYITITSIVDASAELKGGQFDKMGPLIKKYLDVFVELGKGKPEEARTKAKRGLDISDVNTFFYTNFWEKNFLPQVLEVESTDIDKESGLRKDGDITSRLAIGSVFADFRGFITCEKYEPRDLEYQGKEIQGPFYRTDEGARGQWQRTSIPDGAWADYRLREAWPFLSAVPKDDVPTLTGRTEFTASRVLCGRALYVTALGPQPRFGTQGNERPLYLYVHSVTQCERQIGRLIDRIVQLGTLRLAAIVALPGLKAVSQKLELVENDITKARTQTHQLIQMAQSSKHLRTLDEKDKHIKNLEEKERSILAILDEIQTSIANLSEGRDPKDGEYLGDASLEYRLIRSRYYKDGFYGLIKGLRIKRLEGYQPYDEFVERRLGSIFRFIQGVERRITQIKAEWRSLDQLYLTTTVTILTAGIDQQQEETKTVQKSIESIQLVGESVLIGVLAPYYFLNLVFDATDCQHSRWCQAEWNGFSSSQYLTVLVWTVFVILAVLRMISTRAR